MYRQPLGVVYGQRLMAVSGACWSRALPGLPPLYLKKNPATGHAKEKICTVFNCNNLNEGNVSNITSLPATNWAHLFGRMADSDRMLLMIFVG